MTARATIDDGGCTFVDGICESCVDGVIVTTMQTTMTSVMLTKQPVVPIQKRAMQGRSTDTDNSLCRIPMGYPENIVDCDGACLNDADNDQVCDEDEIPGCTDDAACNYSASATDENGSCEYPIDIFGLDYVDCDGNCLNDADEDLVCDEEESAGCTDPEACNAGDFTDTDDDLCEYPDGYPNNIVDCDNNCLNDSDNDQVCDETRSGRLSGRDRL